jgi:hypothetical protein
MARTGFFAFRDAKPKAAEKSRSAPLREGDPGAARPRSDQAQRGEAVEVENQRQELRHGDHPPPLPGRPGQTVKGRDVNRLERRAASPDAKIATNFDISASTAPPRRIAGKRLPRGPRSPPQRTQRDDFLAGFDLRRLGQGRGRRPMPTP